MINLDFEIDLNKIIDKLNFYIGFLESFTEKGVKFLKENDILSLRMTREWILEAIKKLKNGNNNMDKNIEYLQHEINLYKNIPYKIRNSGKRINYQIIWNDIYHKELIEISKLHGLHLSELIQIILKDFLENRKNFKKIRNKLNKR